MKSQKGITLTVLIIYIVIMCFVISMLATVSTFFFDNTDQIKTNAKYIAEYNKFNMYFIEDVKNNEEIERISSNEIVFKDGTVYTYKGSSDRSIYRNKVKICKNISYCNFSKAITTVNDVEKKIVNVHMVIEGSGFFETNNEYVLKYW